MKSLNETTQLVRDEHKKLRGLMRQLEGLSPRRGSRERDYYRAVIGELCFEIQIYVELEERVLFPRLHAEIKKEAGGETPASEYIHQCLSDHAEIARQIRETRAVLAAAKGAGGRDGQRLLEETLDELRASTEAHMNGDEKELLPLMERHFPRLDAELSMKWFDTADEIRARIGATRPSDPSHAQNPHGGEQRRRAS